MLCTVFKGVILSISHPMLMLRIQMEELMFMRTLPIEIKNLKPVNILEEL